MAAAPPPARWAAVLVVIGLLVAGIAPAKPADAVTADASPAVPGGFRSWSELMATQERLNAAGTRIVAASDRIGAASGYAGIVAAPQSRTLRVYWMGALPAAVSAQVAVIRRDVPVEVLPAAYSNAELQREVRRLVARPDVTVAGPNVDGSGLFVRISGNTMAALDSAVPVTVERAPAPVLTGAKQDDESPYYGAARWKIGTGGCSSGFAVRHGGVSKMLSAGHCGANGQNAVDGAGDPMGVIGNDNNGRDTLLINTASVGHLYTGAYNSATTRSVGGASGSFAGNLVCRSSSYSDETCRILVTRIDQTLNAGSYSIFPVVQAEQLEHAAAAGQGDSGGSVFAYRSADSKVTAFGTVTGGDVGNTTVPCTGITGTRICSWRMYYVDIAKTLAHYGATLVTS